MATPAPLPEPTLTPITSTANPLNPASTPAIAPNSVQATTDFGGLVNTVRKPVESIRPITEPETVRGQLTSLIAEDSPYLQSAKNYALSGMNDRGLVSSSLAVGAAQRAAIDAATPIAGQDAQTYTASGVAAQNANAAVNKTAYDAALKNQAVNLEAGYSASLQKQKDDAYATLNLTLKRIDERVELDKIALQDRDSFSKSVGPIMQQYQTEFSRIQVDPNFASPSEKATAIQMLNNIYKPQISAINSIYGYTLKWTNV